MKKMILISLLLIGMASADWEGPGSITAVTLHGTVYLLNTTIESGCPVSGQNPTTQFYWSVEEPYSKEMLSLALTALTTGLQIKVYELGTHTAPICDGSNGKMVYIELKK